MPPKLAALAALGLIALGTVLHGATTHRWQEVSTTGGRFDAAHALAVSVGDYKADVVPNDLPLKEKSVATVRRYVSLSRNRAFVVSLTTGAPGSVATHTPDVCYPGSGYKIVKDVTRETVEVPGLGSVSYFSAEFEKKTASHTDRQRVRWNWAHAGKFAAPERPRLAYFRVADLAKLYIVSQLAPGDIAPPDGPADPAVAEFLSAAYAQYAQVLGER